MEGICGGRPEGILCPNFTVDKCCAGKRSDFADLHPSDSALFAAGMAITESRGGGGGDGSLLPSLPPPPPHLLAQQKPKKFFITSEDIFLLAAYRESLERSPRSQAYLAENDDLDFLSREDAVKLQSWLEEEEGKEEEKENGGVVVVDSNEELTFKFLRATSKPCPNCDHIAGGHYLAHHCHHIYDGCEKCHEEYCYKCLHSGKMNREAGRSYNECLCGGWSNGCNGGYFFSQQKINRYIKSGTPERPYPHDSRCGCCVCPTCAPGIPCIDCDGGRQSKLNCVCLCLCLCLCVFLFFYSFNPPVILLFFFTFKDCPVCIDVLQQGPKGCLI